MKLKIVKINPKVSYNICMYKSVYYCLFLIDYFINMSARKTIQINPDFFKLSGKGKTRRKKRDKKAKRQDLRLSIKPNDIKKKLMAKIKEHQKQKARR